MPATKTIYALLIFFLLDYSCVLAQQPTALKFERVNEDDNISQVFVSSIIQDSKGFMWFTTLLGFNRYDGYKCTIYRHEDSNSNSVASNFVYSVFEDSKQRLWVSTWNNGLDYFDREHNRFYHFFKKCSVKYVHEDAKGNIWTVLNDTVLVCMKIKETKSIQNNQPPFSLDTTQISFPRNTPVEFTIDNKKNIYITSAYFIGKVFLVNNTNRFVMQKILSFNTPNLSGMRELRQSPLTHKYYTLINYKLFEFANDSFTNPVKIADAFEYNRFFIDSSGFLWLGFRAKNPNNSYGEIIDLNTHAIKKIVSEDNSDNKFFGYLYTGCQDKNGVIWLGSSGYSILKYSPIQNRFNHRLGQNKFYGLVPVNDTDLLVGYRLKMHINKDYSLRLDTLHSDIIPDEEDVIRFDDTGVDSTGNYWRGNNNISLNNIKLIHYNPVLNKTLEIINIKDTANKYLREKLSVLFDKDGYAKNQLGLHNFFIVNSYVLFSFDDLFISYNTTNKKIAIYPFVKIDNQRLQSSDYYKDEAGFIWIGNVNSCYRLNIINGETRKYVFNENLNRTVRCFCDDPLQPAAYIWLGTLDGLTRMNKQTGVCENYYGKNGLPAMLITGILSDANNNLWIGGGDGLYRLRLNNFTVEKFNITDGLQGNGVNTYSHAKMKNGLLVFGGLNGLNFFKPEDIKPRIPAGTIITDFKLFGKSVKYAKSGSMLKQDITYTNNVSVSYRSNIITIEFAGIDYNKKQGLQYRYKLNGFDEKWNYSGTINIATYTNLDPKTYHFIVQASNTLGIWGPSNASFQLQVTPLWWQTWLFKILVGVAVFALTFILYRYRLRSALRVERVRNRIASDLHDEIGSTLSSLNIYSKIVQNQLLSGTNISKSEILLQKINDNSKDAMEAMSDIVWSINTKNDQFENIIARLQDQAIQNLEIKGYTVHFNFEEGTKNLKLKMEKRKDFYLIYKEAVNNIAKHANGSNVWITLFQKDHYLTLNIKDDGKGFNKATIRDNANGVNNMQERAATIGGKITIDSSRPGEGTTIALTFPYK